MIATARKKNWEGCLLSHSGNGPCSFQSGYGLSQIGPIPRPVPCQSNSGRTGRNKQGPNTGQGAQVVGEAQGADPRQGGEHAPVPEGLDGLEAGRVGARGTKSGGHPVGDIEGRTPELAVGMDDPVTDTELGGDFPQGPL